MASLTDSGTDLWRNGCCRNVYRWTHIFPPTYLHGFFQMATVRRVKKKKKEVGTPSGHQLPHWYTSSTVRNRLWLCRVYTDALRFDQSKLATHLQKKFSDWGVAYQSGKMKEHGKKRAEWLVKNKKKWRWEQLKKSDSLVEEKGLSGRQPDRKV